MAIMAIMAIVNHDQIIPMIGIPLKSIQNLVHWWKSEILDGSYNFLKNMISKNAIFISLTTTNLLRKTLPQ